MNNVLIKIINADLAKREARRKQMRAQEESARNERALRAIGITPPSTAKKGRK